MEPVPAPEQKPAAGAPEQVGATLKKARLSRGHSLESVKIGRAHV
jgi:hypothetical protein